MVRIKPATSRRAGGAWLFYLENQNAINFGPKIGAGLAAVTSTPATTISAVLAANVWVPKPNVSRAKEMCGEREGSAANSRRWCVNGDFSDRCGWQH
jgi:hypothetical protein